MVSLNVLYMLHVFPDQVSVQYCSVWLIFAAQHIDEALTPSPLVEKNMEKHVIFQVPIIVVPGEFMDKDNSKVFRHKVVFVSKFIN